MGFTRKIPEINRLALKHAPEAVGPIRRACTLTRYNHFNMRTQAFSRVGERKLL
jgi:hypothetical protein